MAVQKHFCQTHDSVFWQFVDLDENVIILATVARQLVFPDNWQISISIVTAAARKFTFIIQADMYFLF